LVALVQRRIKGKIFFHVDALSYSEAMWNCALLSPPFLLPFPPPFKWSLPHVPPGFLPRSTLASLGEVLLGAGCRDASNPNLSTAEQLEHHGRNFCGFALDGGQLVAGGSWHGLEGMESWKHTIIGIGPRNPTTYPKHQFTIGSTIFPCPSFIPQVLCGILPSLKQEQFIS
jgi:hypothetical protein